MMGREVGKEDGGRKMSMNDSGKDEVKEKVK